MTTPAPQQNPPKSILKPSSAPGTLAADQAAAAKAREVATTHAKIIHHRWGIEDQIGDAIVELCRYPLAAARGDGAGAGAGTACYSAADPAPSDAEGFRAGIRLFQPSDYDDLIEERNANGRCGYVLCPEARRRVAGAGEWKIVGSHILPKKEVERWCSQACAKRAMYVKIQLSETAAWERAGIDTIQIDLYEEPGSKNKKEGAEPAGQDARLAQDRVGQQQVEAQRKAAKDAKELALERGESGEPQNQRDIPIRIREKPVTRTAEGPSLGKDDGHLVLDGYKTKFENNQLTAEVAPEEDDTSMVDKS
ncbi:hypothetical protein JX265_012990 [Neoarthrinium moseri]|uniref:RNA polymerase II subunit B1 CTD phosphatase RPAP2 homolog n=1 Tax=Neoarthrinium moseri TaxID=1658444 RepID=A0A9Q0AJ06_9PEZI|nr:hypothetical protein JX265_012990 [Neoarthrinium moseri]